MSAMTPPNNNPNIHLIRVMSALSGASSICRSFLVINSVSPLAPTKASTTASAWASGNPASLPFLSEFEGVKCDGRHDSNYSTVQDPRSSSPSQIMSDEFPLEL